MDYSIKLKEGNEIVIKGRKRLAFFDLYDYLKKKGITQVSDETGKIKLTRAYLQRDSYLLGIPGCLHYRDSRGNSVRICKDELKNLFPNIPNTLYLS